MAGARAVPVQTPPAITGMPAALERHGAQADEAPYIVDALGRLVRMAVQRLSAHTASLQTTSIYIRAERRRMLEAAARYYADHC